MNRTESLREVIPSTPSSPRSCHIGRGNSSRKGDLAEYYAVTWLWDNGYEVFKNSGCNGPIDMIAMDKNGETIFIDVKTAYLPAKTGPVYRCTKRSEVQIKLGVKHLLFTDNKELIFAEHDDNETK